jgi:hypothetical protein
MNITVVVILVVGLLWAIGTFFGVIGQMSKPFKSLPYQSNSAQIRLKEQETIEDTEAKRKKLMEDMKQRISDGARKY